MTELFSLLLLAFAVSLDSFSTGLTYGLRKVQIPLKSISIISVCSASSLLVAMMVGGTIQKIISPEWAGRIGGLILVAIGAAVLYQFFRPEKQDIQPSQEKTLINFEIKSIGLVIQILRRPLTADFDRSGTITGIEALMLGIALSLDAFGAGIGAALLHFSPLLLSVAILCMSFLFLSSGLKLGQFFSHLKWIHRVSFLPGVLLILIGILRF
ncbi:sporulation membrane protein YtaF [Rossellomorea aquimaris]|uniref:sporulation membrane protein YtaF n=1 Tax=Rossellomorea aquimaris TaxID=189382 RepID=UPI001CD72588|nr:sporulation membrane protein YtaF [Rossellomorea aquimaris]MCA1056942.1 sporulation membrane protein YtaF [Rossellomorea aquimaris]